MKEIKPGTLFIEKLTGDLYIFISPQYNWDSNKPNSFKSVELEYFTFYSVSLSAYENYWTEQDIKLDLIEHQESLPTQEE